MKRFFTLAIFIGTLITPLHAEFVFLKDGSIIEGQIVSDASAFITIRDNAKKVKTIQRNSILRILYTSLKMGKVYIQKRDGESIVAFIVDEDRDTYTIRKELYTPQEMTLKRSDVLFIAEKNPSGLKVQGEVGTDSVSLVWLPPYDAVKKYNVYIKKDRAAKYVLAESTWGKSITLKNLSSNTTYFIIVTSVDTDNYESSPSNELKITTKNIPPEKPVIVSGKKSKAGEILLQWNPSIDPDGKVTGYRIYRKYDGKISLLAETKKTEYTVSKNTEADEILVTAVDDMKDESAAAIYYPDEVMSCMSIMASVIFPVGKLKDMADTGYGLTMRWDKLNYVAPKIDAGVELSVFYLPGKNDFIEEESDIGRLLLAPLKFSLGYIIRPFRFFTIIPQVLLGACYINYSYSYFDIPQSEKMTKTRNGIDPLLSADINFRLEVSDALFLTVSGDYTSIVEEKDNFRYFGAGVGAGMKF